MIYLWLYLAMAGLTLFITNVIMFSIDGIEMFDIIFDVPAERAGAIFMTVLAASIWPVTLIIVAAAYVAQFIRSRS